eukprot:261537-Pyramimonas_sp.AAC.2
MPLITRLREEKLLRVRGLQGLRVLREVRRAVPAVLAGAALAALPDMPHARGQVRALELAIDGTVRH